MPRPVVVIPCFDEEERLDTAALLELVADGSLDLVLVDDGSTDRTLELLRELETQSPAIGVLTLPRNVGKAEAVRQGLLLAIDRGAENVAYYDADLSTPPHELQRILRELAARADLDVVLASRVRLLGRDIQRRAHRHYVGRVFATFASLTLALPVYDTQCGAKVFRVTDALRAALARPFTSTWVFDVELLARLLYPGEGVQPTRSEAVLEVPLLRWYDVAGSKLRPFDGLRAARDLALIARATRRTASFRRTRGRS